MQTEIQTLTDLGTEAVQSAIIEYTHWHLINALCWLAFSAVCLVGAILLWKHRKKLGDEECWIVANIGAPILLIIALFTSAYNLPTLLSPKAYAIHQLIIDARRN